MTQTKRAGEFKSKKNAYRYSYVKPELELKIDLSKAKKCGDFKLYDESDIAKVLDFAIKANAEEAIRHA